MGPENNVRIRDVIKEFETAGGGDVGAFGGFGVEASGCGCGHGAFD